MNRNKFFKLKFLLFTFIALSLSEIFSAIAVFSLPKLQIDTFVKSYFEKSTQGIFGGQYNQQLGWDYTPNSQMQEKNVLGETWTASHGKEGERQSLNPGLPLKLAVYGDSFVHGDEVDMQNTWTTYLEQILDLQVKNFGVGGYGTDQAYLKFKQHVSQGKVAPLTILGVFEGDISRIFTNFYPFLTSDTKIRPGFKPAYMLKNGKVVFLPNPANSSMDNEQVKTLILKISKTDWASQRQSYLQKEFPYSLQALKAASSVKDRLIEKFTGRDRLNTWHSRQAKVMQYIVDDFIKTACNHNSAPVLLLLPDTHRWQKGRKDPQYASFRDGIRLEYPGLTVVDIAQDKFDEKLYTLVPLRGHLSAYGNMVVAQSLAYQLPNTGSKSYCEKFDGN